MSRGVAPRPAPSPPSPPYGPVKPGSSPEVDLLKSFINAIRRRICKNCSVRGNPCPQTDEDVLLCLADMLDEVFERLNIKPEDE